MQQKKHQRHLESFAAGETNELQFAPQLAQTRVPAPVAPKRLLRSYSLASMDDFDRVLYQRKCPLYALAWSDEHNARHWPPGHNFK